MLLTTNISIHTSRFIVFLEYSNCSNDSSISFDNNVSLQVLTWIQLVCHVVSLFLSVVSLVVVQYYGIAGHRMNRILLILSIIEVFYNGSSSIYYSIRIFFQSYSAFNIYIRVFFNLFCQRSIILIRNWWIAFISLARFIVIRLSLKGCRIRVTLTNISFIVIIIIGIIYTILFTLWFSVFVIVCKDRHEFAIHVWNIHENSVAYRIGDALTVLLETIAPVLLVIICSFLTYRFLNSREKVTKRSVKRNPKTVKTLLLISIIFTVCQLPSSMIIAFCFVEKESMLQHYPNFENLYKQIKLISLICSAVNSMGNVAVYFASSTDFKTGIHDLCLCRWSFVKFKDRTNKRSIVSSWNSYRKKNYLSTSCYEPESGI